MAFKTYLAAATTVDEVVTAANDYLDLWEEVLHRLPAECRPVEIQSASDVLYAAHVLKQFRWQLAKRDVPEGHELQVTADFFAAAATRIMQLRRKAERPDTALRLVT
jgi:hypothetical protein